MSNVINLPASAQSELIPIQNNDGAQAVLGRDLHAFLEIGKDYSTWFKDMCQYGFIAGQDFTPKSGKTSEAGGRTRIDHIISLEMAKEICMIQRSPLGKQARQYFIECERRAPKQGFGSRQPSRHTSRVKKNSPAGTRESKVRSLSNARH